MPLHCILAISSVSAARVGIDGLVQTVLFWICVYMTISAIGRNEYDPSGAGICGVIVTSLISAEFGVIMGQGPTGLALLCVFSGIAAFWTSGPFLEFRFPHRLLLGFATPAIFLLSALVGNIVSQFVLENALK